MILCQELYWMFVHIVWFKFISVLRGTKYYHPHFICEETESWNYFRNFLN